MNLAYFGFGEHCTNEGVSSHVKGDPQYKLMNCKTTNDADT